MDTSKLSPAAYCLALICFLLPFVELSCKGQRLMSFTGLQLATGTSVQEPQMFGPAKEHKIPPDTMILAVVGLCVVGLVVSLKVAAARPAGVVGSIAAVLLLFFKAKTDNSVLSEGAGMIQVQYGVGFWGVTVLTALAGVVGLLSRPAAALPPQEQSTSVSPPGPSSAT